jgi:hypothetical protein
MSLASPRVSRALRSRPVVLGAAFCVALAAIAITGNRSHPPGPRHGSLQVVAEARAADPAPPAAPTPPPAPESPKGDGKTKIEAGIVAGEAKVDAEITIDERGVRVGKPGSGGPRVHVGDREYDSFETFVEQAPWIAGLVFMTTALVFLVPLVVIIVVIWYKMRRNRMMNETMLKLAERGIVPPGEAMQAIADGRPAAAIQAGPSTGPLYEQAKALRKRAAWSDLRKGVIMAAIGLGLAIWGALEDGTPNGLGLILLFVGLGFVLLWYFEDRQAQERREGPRPPVGGA